MKQVVSYFIYNNCNKLSKKESTVIDSLSWGSDVYADAAETMLD